MKYKIAILTISSLLFFTASIMAQSQTDRYTINKAIIDDDNLTYPYITQLSHFNISTDESDMHLEIVTNYGDSQSFGALEFLTERNIIRGKRELKEQDFIWQFKNSYDNRTGNAKVTLGSAYDQVFVSILTEDNSMIKFAGRCVDPTEPSCSDFTSFLESKIVDKITINTPLSELNTKLTFYAIEESKDFVFIVKCENRFGSIEIYQANIKVEELRSLVKPLATTNSDSFYMDYLRPHFNDLFCSYRSIDANPIPDCKDATQ